MEDSESCMRAKRISRALQVVGDIRAYLHMREDMNMKSVRMEELKKKRDAALEALEQSADLRKALFYLPTASSHTPTVDSVVAIWTVHFPGLNNRTPQTGETMACGRWLQSIFQASEDQLDATQLSVREFVLTTIPHTAARRFLSSAGFWKNLLTQEMYEGTLPISLDVVYDRLKLFDQALKRNPSFRPSTSDAGLWLDNDHRTRQQLLLRISSRFPLVFATDLQRKSEYAYLDDIALDMGFSNPGAFKKECKKKNQSFFQQQPMVIKAIDLRDTGTDELLGTVMQIDNALSPGFCDRFLVGMDRARYTQDGNYTKHDRGYRFASMEHKEDGVLPSWLMFGDGSTSTLLLSQHTNSVEVALLQVVNYVYRCYSKFVNDEVDLKIGSRTRDLWGLHDHGGFFDSLMTMVANPANSTYGEHDDGKPGLCVQDKIVDGLTVPNKDSKFNMVVPTVAIQNHEKRSTTVEFYDKGKKVVGVVSCGVMTIHIQLIGVQHNCTHAVSCFKLFFPFSDST